MSQNKDMEEDTRENKSRNRVEDWIMHENGDTNKMPRKNSMIKNIMYSDDVLIVVCPSCMTGRVAASTRRNLNKFMEIVTEAKGTGMTGLIVVSYCNLGSDKCMYKPVTGDESPNTSITALLNSSTYEMMDNILGEITILPSDIVRDKAMFLTSDELVNLCRSMHRIPLKIGPDDIIWPDTDDKWTDMGWVM